MELVELDLLEEELAFSFFLLLFLPFFPKRRALFKIFARRLGSGSIPVNLKMSSSGLCPTSSCSSSFLGDFVTLPSSLSFLRFRFFSLDSFFFSASLAHASIRACSFRSSAISSTSPPSSFSGFKFVSHGTLERSVSSKLWA